MAKDNLNVKALKSKVSDSKYSVRMYDTESGVEIYGEDGADDATPLTLDEANAKAKSILSNKYGWSVKVDIVDYDDQDKVVKSYTNKNKQQDSMDKKTKNTNVKALKGKVKDSGRGAWHNYTIYFTTNINYEDILKDRKVFEYQQTKYNNDVVFESYALDYSDDIFMIDVYSQLSVDNLKALFELKYKSYNVEVVDIEDNGLDETVGESYLFAPSTAMDGAEWKVSVDMPEPNGSAYARFYLAYDLPSIEKGGSGYFLRIGDSKRFLSLCYQKASGSISTLAKSDTFRLSASEGEKNIHVDLKVKRSAKGIWKIYSKLNGERSYKEEFSVTDLTATSSLYSGLYCKYPKSKANDFRFDDWIVTGTAVANGQTQR